MIKTKKLLTPHHSYEYTYRGNGPNDCKKYYKYKNFNFHSSKKATEEKVLLLFNNSNNDTKFFHMLSHSKSRVQRLFFLPFGRNIRDLKAVRCVRVCLEPLRSLRNSTATIEY